MPHLNRIDKAIENRILSYSLKYPTHHLMRVSHQLRLQEIQVNVDGVRGVLSRHNLLTRQEDLLRLEKSVQGKKDKLTEEQFRALERFNPEFR